MSEVCALEILEKQGLIIVIDKEYKFDFIDNRYADECNVINTVKLPVKEITIVQEGDEFASRFRELMKKNGYHFEGSRMSARFVKEKDVKEFIEKIPWVEIMYTNPVFGLLRRLIEEFSDIEIVSIRTHIDDYFRDGHSSRQAKIKRFDVRKERKERERVEELKAIEFMEQLF